MGYLKGTRLNRGAFEATGAITGSYSGATGGSDTTKNYSTNSELNFDASLSNPIYGNSETVSPLSTAVNFFLKF